MITRKMTAAALSGLALLSVAGCTNPYDPGQRAVGGALLGAGSGAAIGGIAGGGRGAAVGALIGGVGGAAVGAATTPAPPPSNYGYAQPAPGYARPAPGYYQPAPGYYQPAPQPAPGYYYGY